MTRRIYFVSIGIVLVLLAIVFWAGRASASTGCFTDTNDHWAELYICWLKDNGIASGYGNGTYGPEDYIKRGEMAKMLFKQVEIPPSSGAIVLNIGSSDWYQAGAYNDPLLIKYNYYTSFGKNSTGTQLLDTSPTLPVTLYGRNLAITGFQICYDVIEANGHVDLISMKVYNMDPSGVAAPSLKASTDLEGPLTNTACVISTLASPAVLDLHTRIVIQVYTDNTVAGEVVRIGRASLTLVPTSTLYVP